MNPDDKIISMDDLIKAWDDISAAYSQAAQKAVVEAARQLPVNVAKNIARNRQRGGAVARPVWGDAYEPEPDDAFYTDTPILGFRGIDFNNGRFQGGYGGSWNTGMHVMHCSATNPPPRYAAERHLESPGWQCNCGIYAHKRPYVGHCSGGLFTLVGMEHVVEHELGYRAGRAWVIAAAWKREPDWNNLHLEQKRAHLLIEHTWPMQPMVCRSVEKLLRVHDYYTNNPGEIPVPRDEYWRLAAEDRKNSDRF